MYICDNQSCSALRSEHNNNEKKKEGKKDGGGGRIVDRHKTRLNDGRCFCFKEKKK